MADRWEMRRLINSFLSPAVFLPEGNGEWEEAFKKYQSINLKKIKTMTKENIIRQAYEAAVERYAAFFLSV